MQIEERKSTSRRKFLLDSFGESIASHSSHSSSSSSIPSHKRDPLQQLLQLQYRYSRYLKGKMTSQWSGFQRDIIKSEERAQRRWNQKYGQQFKRTEIVDEVETTEVPYTEREYTIHSSPTRSKKIRTTTTRIVEVPQFRVEDDTYSDLIEEPVVRAREVWVKKLVPERSISRTQIPEAFHSYRADEYRRPQTSFPYQYDSRNDFFLDTPRDFGPRTYRSEPRDLETYVDDAPLRYAKPPESQLRLTRSGTTLTRVAGKKMVGVTVRETQRGCLVKTVEPGLAAERSGIRVGDTLTHINDQPIRTLQDFKYAMDKAGVKLTIEVDRKGHNVQFDIRR